MIVHDGMNQMRQLVEIIGLESALRIVAAWGGSTLYVPATCDPDHLIAKIVGLDAAEDLERHFGSQTIDVPKLNLKHIKLEVDAVKLVDKGFSTREAAHILGVSKERVKQIVGKHRRGVVCQNDTGDRSEKFAGDPHAVRAAGPPTRRFTLATKRPRLPT